MAHRKGKRHRRNPTVTQWILIGVGTVAAGGAAYAIYRVAKGSKTPETKLPVSGLSPPRPDRPIPPIPPIDDDDEGGLGQGGGCDPEYIGFVFDGEGCVPTEATPAGIYVAEGCRDFVFVKGEDGEQLDFLEAQIGGAAQRTKIAVARSADPTRIVTRYFDTFWGECTWPPPPTAANRVKQLYQAMVYTVGREIVAAGGRVLGTNDPDIVDEQIAERLAELGFFDFDPDVVPEIVLPDAEPDPPGPGVQPPAKPGQLSFAP